VALTDSANGQLILEKLVAQLDAQGITAEEIGRISRLSYGTYQGLTKNANDQAEIHTMERTGFSLSPKWADGPEWPVIQPAAPVKVPPIRRGVTTGDRRVTVIFPDTQFGFRRIDGVLHPMHDPAAIDVALQIARHAQPDRIVDLGDTLDLSEWSMKFAVLAEFVDTTQPALNVAHQMLEQQRSICDRVDLIAGNHDARLSALVVANARAALRLRPAGDPPDSWPSLSIQRLLSLDDLGVTYHDGYPAGRVKLTEGTAELSPLWAIHGEKLDVRKVAEAERQSFVQGHIHRISSHERTYEMNGAPWIVRSFSPGCLCRIDGAVPSTKGGTDANGRPVLRFEDWQQGVSIVTESESGWWSQETVPIHRGRAEFRGRTFDA